MQEENQTIETATNNGFLSTINDIFNYELINFGVHNSRIVFTVGLVLMFFLAIFITKQFLKFLRFFLTKKFPSDDRKKFISIFIFIKYILYVIILLITLSAAGINLTLLVTASAALFVGLGFALKNLFQDIIAGIYIILDKSLFVGDIIQINNHVGRVIEIKLRTTRILTRDEKIIIIPNHSFIDNLVENYTQNNNITRECVRVGVAYGSDVELVKNLLLQSIQGQNYITSKQEPYVFFEDFGDSALIFSIYFFISNSFIAPKIRSEVRFKIDQLFRENNIKIPFPQREIHIQNNTNPKIQT